MELQLNNQNDFSKERLSSEIALMKEQIEQGNANPLKVAAALAFLERYVKELKEINKNHVLVALQMYGKEGADLYGSSITPIEAATKYDYTSCNDSVYNSLLAQKESIEKELSGREMFLRSLPKEGITRVDEATGEIEVIVPPIKKSTSSYQVKLK